MGCKAAGSRSPVSVRTILLAGLVCLLQLCETSDPASALADDGQDEYNLGAGLYKLGRWKLAADSFRKVVQQYPKHVKVPLAQFFLGQTLVKLEKYSESRNVLRGFVKDYPKSKYRADAMYRVAECSYLLGDLEPAESEFASFLKAYSNSDWAEWALPDLADVQRRRNKPREAVANYRRALQRFPNSRLTEETKFGLARSYEALRRTDDAVGLYEQLAANRAGERAAEAQMKLATIYFDEQKYDQAAEGYVRLVEQFPESPLRPEAELNAGFAYYQHKQYRQAITRFEHAAQNERQRLTADYWKGISLKSLAEYGDAVAILEATFKANADGPLGENILYQWADCELRRKRFEQAGGLFLDLVKRWPNAELADDSLFYAAEVALLGGKLNEAAALVDRFSHKYPGSGLRMYNKLLRGRVLVAFGGETNFKAAVQHFDNVLETSNKPRTQSEARYHLARTLQRLNDDVEALKTIAPLVEKIRKQGTDSSFLDALILAGHSQLALQKYEAADETMSLYLKRTVDQPHSDDKALAVRSISRAHLGRKLASQADLETIADRFAESTLVAKTVYRVAEIAYEAKDWDWSARLYETIVQKGPSQPHLAHALSGLAWCRFEQQKYDQAATYFAQVVAEFPEQKVLAPEAAFKLAEALQKAERLSDAAAAYEIAFQKFAPAAAAKTGDELRSPELYAYRSGLYRARVLRTLNKIAAADKAYQALLTRFPKPKKLDERLDEWALLNYDAGNYKRSDEIFQRLVTETPDSPLADNAQLSLAESELIAGRLDAARKAFDALQQSAAADEQVQEVSLRHLVGITVEQEKWNETLKLASDFLDRFSESSYRGLTESQLGNAQLNLGKLNEALKTFQKLKTEKAEPVDGEDKWIPQIWIMIAEIYARMKKYDDVDANIAELRIRSPKYSLFYQTDEITGRCRKNQARFEDARTAFRRVISDAVGRRSETAAKSQFLFAETYLIQKDYATARREYFKVYVLHTKYPTWQAASLFQAAKCDEALNQWNNAADAYEDLIEEFPKSDHVAEAKLRLQLARKKLVRK